MKLILRGFQLLHRDGDLEMLGEHDGGEGGVFPGKIALPSQLSREIKV